MQRALDLLVIQPTPFCNIDCSYCYLPERSSAKLMADETLECLFDDLFTGPLVSDQLTIAWHAGEPLVAGVSFYERAFAIIHRLNRKGIRVVHNIQTNGTLIDNRWVNFFKHHDAHLGLSIDGPKRIHDSYRKTRRGGGTYERVMHAVHLLQAAAVPFHVITVLTRASLEFPEELFDFYTEHNIANVGFNIEEIEGKNSSSSLRGVDPGEIRRFFERLLMRMNAQPGRLEVRELTEARNALMNRNLSKYGNPQTEPLRIISVGTEGELSTFSPELLGCRSSRYGTFVFGNVKDGELTSMLHHRNFLKVEHDINAGIEICKRDCEYFDVCLGGAPSNKFFETGTFACSETDYCRYSKKAIIDVVLGCLERELGITH